MNAELPYMIRIANALKKLSGGSVGSTAAATAKTVRTSSSSSSGVTTKDVIDNLENALFTTVTEEVDGEDVDVRYAALARLKETLVKELHDAFFVTVTEEVPVEDGEEGETQEEEVEYSVFHLMRNEIAELKALHIRQILSHLSVQVLNEGEENETSVLVSDITLASQKNVVAGGVGDGSESGGGGGSSTLAGLVDTSITSPQNGQILVYDTTNDLNKWKNVSPTLGMLSDVTIDAQNLTDGQALLYDATNHVWTPGTVTSSGALTIVNTDNAIGTTATTIATINGNAITAKIPTTLEANITIGTDQTNHNFVVKGNMSLTGDFYYYGAHLMSANPNTTLGTAASPWAAIYGTNIYGTTIYEGGTALSSKYILNPATKSDGQILTYKVTNGVGAWVAANAPSTINVDSAISATSTNPLQNKVIYETLQGYVTSQSLSDTLGGYVLSSTLANYITSSDLDTALQGYALASDIPTVYDGVLKIKMNGTNNGTTFTANKDGETIIDLGTVLTEHQYLGFVASTNQGTVNPASGHATTNTTTYLNLIGGTSSAHAFKAGVKITGSQNISVSSVGGVLTITGPATVGENNVIETIKLNDETLAVDNKVVTIAFDLNDITGVNIDTQNLDNGQVLMYNSTSNKWVAGTIPGLTPITIDDEIKSNSSNPVKNSVIYNALQGKQDVIDTDHKLSYDLITDQPNIPSVGNGVLKIRMNNVDNSTTFSANSSSAVTIDLGTVLTTHQDISGKVDKPSNFTNGHLMAFDSNGDIADSGLASTDLVTNQILATQLAGYLPLTGGTLTGNLAIGSSSSTGKTLTIYGSSSAPTTTNARGIRLYGESSNYTDLYRSSSAFVIAGDTSITGDLDVGTYGNGNSKAVNIWGTTSEALRIYCGATSSSSTNYAKLYYSSSSLNVSKGMDIGGDTTVSGTLDVTGNVSVGANSAVNKNRTLTDYGPSSSAALKIYGGTNVNYYTDIYRSSSALVIDGDVNIGTSSSSHNNMTFKVFGNIGATGNVVAGVTSDRRLKKDIRSITLKEAEDVLSVLNPVVYNWNEKAEELGGLHGAGRGFLADEYLDILPNAGRKIWGEYDAIDYNQVIPYLVAGWQQTNLRIRILEAEVTFLKEENERLNRKVRNAIQ